MNTVIGPKSPLPTTTSFSASASSSSGSGAGGNHLHRVHTKTHPAHSMIAGYVAGFSGTIVGFPLDSLKVWLQTNTMGKNKFLDTTTKSSSSSAVGSRKGPNNTNNYVVSSSSSKVYGANRNISTSTTISGAISSKTTHQKPIATLLRTFRALYSGVSVPLVTVGMVQSVNFAMYDATRQFLYHRQQQYDNTHRDNQSYINNSSNDREYLTRDSLAGVAISGSVAGMVTAVLTAPLIMIKINQQINGNPFRVAFKETFVLEQQQKGRFLGFRFRPFGAAFLPHLFSESIGRAIYVTAYEGLKRYLLATKENKNLDTMNNGLIVSLSLQERMACAAVSGILCWAIFYPSDSLRSRLYHAASQQLHNQKQHQQLYNNNKSITSTIVETVRIMRKERSFYRGFSISLLRAGPVAAAVLPVYDLTLERLSSSSY